jgi:hypothetical protein
MFTPARDFLLETPWRIIIPNPNVNSQKNSARKGLIINTFRGVVTWWVAALGIVFFPMV